jgi:putative heme-binding domain-containing protein
MNSRFAVCRTAFIGLLLLGQIPMQRSSAQSRVPDPSAFRLADGFVAELVVEVPPEMGSWVSLTTTPAGLVACDQYGKLYRIHPRPENGAPAVIEPLDVAVGNAQGLLWAFDCLYVVANQKDEATPAGLYRVTDSHGDGNLDKAELLHRIEGGGEHGPHAVIAGPDGKSLYLCAGNHTALPEIRTSRVPRNWMEDNLLPRIWDPGGHAVGIMAPGGWICKTDPDGRDLELVSSGYRNEYDIAFDSNGELFTYDADMEWDIGTPWYRPTRVCHATSGSEFGWRGGDAKWPIWFADGLPPVIDIGPGSPTGIVFGTGARFPDKYQRALFIADWSFGFIYAIHLIPEGASFRAEKEVFCSAPALQVTDMTIHGDGNLYFAIGGRRTPSALYRIRNREPQATVAACPSPTEAAKTRRWLESFHLTGCAAALDDVWAFLGDSDRFVRYAARVAIEQTPLEEWQERAANETDPQRVLELAIALARCLPAGADSQARLLQMLETRLVWDSLNEFQRLEMLRAAGLMITRHGPLDQAAGNRLNQLFRPHFPDSSSPLNRELARLLAVTGAAGMPKAGIALLESAETQEDQIHYAMCLRVVRDGWTTELRKRYLEWFARSAILQGGKSFAGYLRKAREEFIAGLSEADAAPLAALIRDEPAELDPYAELRARPVVKDWSVSDLMPSLESVNWQERSRQNGRAVFTQAQCYKCHQFAGSGGIVGPDLTGLSRRYSTEYLLETILDPDKAISDQYQATVFELDDGRVIVGRVANLNGNDLLVQTDMIAPGKLTAINRDTIVQMRPSTTSPMPADLLNSFGAADILDLMAFLRSADGGGH